MVAHRTLICTFTAIASGLFGAYVGNQLSAIAQTRNCEAQPWGISSLCKVTTAPTALWRGSFTGFWTGAIVGAFVAGSATHKTIQGQSALTDIPTDPEASDFTGRSPETITPPSLELTSLQTEVLYCLLVLLAAQSHQLDALEATPTPTRNTALYLPQFRAWAETMAQSQSPTYDVTKLPDVSSLNVSETRQLLIAAGFSTQAVDQAWQILQAAGPTSSSA